MNPQRTFAVLAASVLTGCASNPATYARLDQSKEAERIRQRLDEILDAAATKDLVRLDSYHCYGSRFTKFAPDQLGREDADAARKAEHDGLSAISAFSMEMGDLKIDVFGDLAVVTFIADSRFNMGTQAFQKKQRATLVFFKDQGFWKITHEHFSPFNPTNASQP